MRALICRQWGSVEDLELTDMPEPIPGPDQISIAVRASSVNFADSLMVAGKYQTKPDFPFAPGLEASGQVIAVGERVTKFKPGDEVMALLAHGGFAEQALADEDQVFPLFPGMDHTLAASFLVAYISSDVALRWQGRLQAGETVAILGAAGGSGLAAVEIAKAMGARVIACASSDKRLAMTREHGADAVVNYATHSLKDEILALTGGNGADVCFDPVGGDLFDQALSSLDWGGRYVHFGFAGGVPQIPANRLLVKNRSAVGASLRYFRWRRPDLMARTVKALEAYWRDGRLKPVVTHRLPLEKGIEAIQLLTERKATGKVVVEIGSLPS